VRLHCKTENVFRPNRAFRAGLALLFACRPAGYGNPVRLPRD
jgi:hypothetical protein